MNKLVGADSGTSAIAATVQQRGSRQSRLRVPLVSLLEESELNASAKWPPNPEMTPLGQIPQHTPSEGGCRHQITLDSTSGQRSANVLMCKPEWTSSDFSGSSRRSADLTPHLI